jgi:ankyrin repeat protein
VDARDSNGSTPLEQASSWGRFEVAQLLLERGAAVNTRNKAGKSPLDAAVENGHEQVAALLRSRAK